MPNRLLQYLGGRENFAPSGWRGKIRKKIKKRLIGAINGNPQASIRPQ
ncbi:hypothetical protein QCA84_005032 [Escherichia coli]|nr:hypothetical protein [Escherichia coli]EES9562690.1 hypothetical protein [Escherichia coli]EEU1621170.1 hypothetical protein [Escherichia coli]EEV9791461.1 hypothetical protein [Escherichia coli]EEW1328433.1 hypothetical protein [Escherichia coli]EFA9400278.1 hypothetical protein [Escherichia coli]